jgi:erythromycin esterase
MACKPQARESPAKTSRSSHEADEARRLAERTFLFRVVFSRRRGLAGEANHANLSDHRSVRLSRLCSAVATLVAIVAASVSGKQNDESFEHWAAVHALPLRTVEPGGDAADLRQLASVIGRARIVALGEPAHGAHEPLSFRNRLFHYLVEEEGFTAIAIESGLAESRRVQDLVEGGPGDATKIVRESFSYNFGALGENVELVEWMRAYNAGHHRKLTFYGIDLSIGGPRGNTPLPAPFEAALAYLARVDPASAQRERATLAPFMARLPAAASFTPTEHERLGATIDELIAVFDRNRRRFIASTSEAEYAWARQDAVVARQAEDTFRVALPGPPVGPILPGDWRAAEARDRAMAGNVRWALAREGPAGRLLVFAHNAHVKNVPTEGGIWNTFARAPKSMGMHLRSALGDHLIVIGTSSASNRPPLPPAVPDAGSLGTVLANVGPQQFLLDLRPARIDHAVTAWLAERRTMEANFTTSLTLSPGKAFDALLFIQTLTQAHLSSPPHGDAGVTIRHRQRRRRAWSARSAAHWSASSRSPRSRVAPCPTASSPAHSTNPGR